MSVRKTPQLGVNVTAWSTFGYSGTALDESLAEVLRHGFNTVSFVPSWYVSTATACDLAPEPGLSVADESLVEAMERAAGRGLSVVLKPLVDVLGYPVWRGTLDPADRRTWWDRYRRMIEHYAGLAERTHASILVIGTELNQLAGARDTEEWRACIASIRSVFSGALTYSTNEPHEREREAFWDALDFLGVNLYAELAGPDAPLPSEDELHAVWSGVLADLRELHQHWRLPILLTEIGYRSSERALHAPWDWWSASPADSARQAVAYEAAYRAIGGESWIAGVHWWDWPADLATADADATAYCPHGKPAAEVARKWNRSLGSADGEADPLIVPFVSVVVPVRNGEDTIRDCIAALLATEYPVDRREIIVVDNASTDQTAAILATLPVQHVDEPRVGRSHARNRGIHESRGEIVAFIDADCIADSGWLQEIVGAFQVGRPAGVAGEIMADEPRTAAQRFMAQREPRWQSVALHLPERFAITANVAFHRDVFEQVGYFDPRFVTAEDVDFGWRFFAVGLQMAYCPTALVAHRMRASGWDLCVQQQGLGYGRVLLREHYDLPRGYALPTWQQIGEAARSVVRSNSPGSSSEQRAFAFYELLTLFSLRLGALRRDLARPLSRFASV